MALCPMCMLSPLCAKLLSDVEKGIQSFDTSTIITKKSLVTWSPITEKNIGKIMTLKQACSAAMIMSDNTAANIVLTGIKGPKALTQFMRDIGDDVTRLDRIEPDLNQAIDGDKRDTTTPNAMVKSLHTLLFGDELSQISKDQLKQPGNYVCIAIERLCIPAEVLPIIHVCTTNA